MQSKGIRVVAAVLLAVVGTFVLVRYVDSARADAVAAESPVDVLVVDQPIAKGTAASAIGDKVRVEAVPARLKAPDAVTDLATLASLHATSDLLPGEQVVRARFADAATAKRGDIPPNLLQVTVELSPDRALGGNIRPGDTVGLVLSFKDLEGADGQVTYKTTHLELHKVHVAAVQGQALAEAPEAQAKSGVTPQPAGRYLVTLALDAASL